MEGKQKLLDDFLQTIDSEWCDGEPVSRRGVLRVIQGALVAGGVVSSEGGNTLAAVSEDPACSNVCTNGHVCPSLNTCTTLNSCTSTNTCPSVNSCTINNICTVNQCSGSPNSCENSDVCQTNTCSVNTCVANTCTVNDSCGFNQCMVDTDCGYLDFSCAFLMNTSE